MPKHFDDFDLNLEFINLGIAPCDDSCGNSIDECSSGSGGTVPTTAPTCFNVCGYPGN